MKTIRKTLTFEVPDAYEWESESPLGTLWVHTVEPHADDDIGWVANDYDIALTRNGVPNPDWRKTKRRIK